MQTDSDNSVLRWVICRNLPCRLFLGIPQHGWAIAQRINQLSKDVLRVNPSALYPALPRLEHQAWVQAEWESPRTIGERHTTL